MTSMHTFKFRRLPAAALAVMTAVAFTAPAAQADTLSPTDDASVILGGAKINKKFGKSQTMVVTSKGSGQAAYVRVDTSTLGSSLVEQAVLRLWVSKVKKPGDIDVLLVEFEWNEDTVNGALAAGLTPSGILVAEDIKIEKANERDFILIPVTTAVQDWLDGGDNFGLAIVARERVGQELIDDGENKILVTFESKESVKTSHQPEIEAVPSAEGSAGSVPTNSVLAFAQTSCPSGFAEYTTARGRYLVGRPSGGTSQGTVGTPLSNLLNRPTGAHNHNVNPPTTSTTTTGNHTHTTTDRYRSTETAGNDGPFNGPQTVGSDALLTFTRTSSTAGNHNHTVNIANFLSSTSGSIANTTTTGTNAPYVQLTMCRKL